MRALFAPHHRWPDWLGRLRLPWPAPALLTWGAAWALASSLLRLGAPAVLAWALAAAVGVCVAACLTTATPLRRLLLALGFPVSALATGLGSGLPAWAWLGPLAVLLAAYPMRAWRDAPLFPTPVGALAGLAALTALPPAARVLDAGCGLGHGLTALRSEWPAARIEGIEWSWPLRLVTALRCPWARVRQGDMWRRDWAGLDLVYLFQRPESMARAWAKAQSELAPGAWLASLEFAVPGVAPTAALRTASDKPVWLYRLPSVDVLHPRSLGGRTRSAATGWDESHFVPAIGWVATGTRLISGRKLGSRPSRFASTASAAQAPSHQPSRAGAPD